MLRVLTLRIMGSNNKSQTDTGNESERSVSPIIEGYHCSEKCPYLEKWDHPFYHHSAWCWKLLKNLSFYDAYLADCQHEETDVTMEKVRNDGRTKFKPNV